MKKVVFTVVVAMSFAVLALAGDGAKDAEGGWRKGWKGRGKPREESVAWVVMNPKVADKLGLDEETRGKIKKLNEENRENMRQLKNKTREAMERQEKLLKEASIDEAAVMSAVDELFECRKQMAKAQTRQLIVVRSLLTPEQIKQAMKEMKSVGGDKGEKKMKGGERDGEKLQCADGEKRGNNAGRRKGKGGKKGDKGGKHND